MPSIATTEGGGGTPLTFKNKTECGRDAFSWQIQYCWDILILLFSKMNLLSYRSSLPLRLSTAHLLYSDSLANSPSLQVLVKESSPVCILHIRAAPETEFYTFVMWSQLCFRGGHASRSCRTAWESTCVQLASLRPLWFLENTAVTIPPYQHRNETHRELYKVSDLKSKLGNILHSSALFRICDLGDTQ